MSDTSVTTFYEIEFQVKLQLTGKSRLTFQFYLINCNLGSDMKPSKQVRTLSISKQNLYYGIFHKFPSLLSNNNTISSKQ